eukprot:gene7164-7006_t
MTGLGGSAWAQSQSTGPTVKLIVGYAAGGPVDSSARVFAPVLSRELGQPVIVENRPGAGGAVAGNTVVKSAPNSLEIFYAASPTMTISPHVLKAMAFDPLKDMTPLATILSYANVLVINQNQAFKTFAELSQKITAATARALQDPELNKRWVDQGYVIWNAKPADLADRMRREHALWAEVTKGMTFE